MGVFPGRPLQDVFTAAAEGAGGTVVPVADVGPGRRGRRSWACGSRATPRTARFRSVFLGFNPRRCSSADAHGDVVERALGWLGVTRGGSYPTPVAGAATHVGAQRCRRRAESRSSRSCAAVGARRR